MANKDKTKYVVRTTKYGVGESESKEETDTYISTLIEDLENTGPINVKVIRLPKLPIIEYVYKSILYKKRFESKLKASEEAIRLLAEGYNMIIYLED